MKVRQIKHRTVVTPWICLNSKGRWMTVRAPRTYWFARSVVPNI